MKPTLWIAFCQFGFGALVRSYTPQAENHDLRDGNWQDDCVQVGSNAYVDMSLTDWREIRLTLWSDRFRARFGT